jgi:hypothetical protein
LVWHTQDTKNDPDNFEVIDYDEASLGLEDFAKVQKWLHLTNYVADSSEFCPRLSSQAPGSGMWIVTLRNSSNGTSLIAILASRSKEF